ncbi:serine palmitoyltransferase 2 [Gautieria morchelliformis]|nr:serine palmitoyltransferase 2 [Gautieria morchelliformis]
MSSFSKRNLPSSPSPIAHPKTTSSSILTRPMRSAASYLTALSQADAEARARKAGPDSEPSEPALSLRSSLTENGTSYLTMTDDSDDFCDDLDRPPHAPTSEQQPTTKHSEFGHCFNEAHRYTSAYKADTAHMIHVEEEPPYYILITTYLSYLFMIIFGHTRDFVGKRFCPEAYRHLMPSNGYAALNSDFDSFYSRRLKARMDDCFSRPITGVPGRTVTLLDRVSSNNNTTLHLTGTKSRALNISSYNYLGFAQAHGGCADAVEEGLRRYGVSACGARLECGTTDLHVQAEALVAKFIGSEDAIIASMGFATNSTTLPALVGKACLVISDELNHASIRFGVRLSGAHVRTFKHNDMKSLETLLREVISQGQPRTHRPWKKILLAVEGLYSMEGTLVNLPAIMQLKARYKFYIYVDEAHSIGALGPHGRGVADYFGIDPRSIDILMGTFTKSFGAAGGYIAGSRDVISRLRTRSHAGCYTESSSPAVLTQIISSMGSIMGISPPLPPITQNGNSPNASSSTSLAPQDAYVYPGPAPSASMPAWLKLPQQLQDGSEGRSRLRRLAFNARYLSRGLNRLGFITYGHVDSPIVPLLLFHPGKMTLFSRLMHARKTPIVVVVVAYPATPLVSGRARFCLSASHTKEDCDAVLRACDEIGEILDVKHGHLTDRWSLEEVTRRAVELVEMD